MNEAAMYGVEIAAGMIVVPWCVFVTVSIFALKQQLAVMKMELSILEDIKLFIKGKS